MLAFDDKYREYMDKVVAERSRSASVGIGRPGPKEPDRSWWTKGMSSGKGPRLTFRYQAEQHCGKEEEVG